MKIVLFGAILCSTLAGCSYQQTSEVAISKTNFTFEEVCVERSGFTGRCEEHSYQAEPVNMVMIKAQVAENRPGILVRTWHWLFG